MHYSQEPIPCQWEQCGRNAITQVFNSAQDEHLYLCPHHRRVALINLERNDSLRHQKAAVEPSKIEHPVTNPLKKRGVEKRPVADPEGWEKEAAHKADASAVPIEPLEVEQEGTLDQTKLRQIVIVPDVPKPRTPK